MDERRRNDIKIPAFPLTGERMVTKDGYVVTGIAPESDIVVADEQTGRGFAPPVEQGWSPAYRRERKRMPFVRRRRLEELENVFKWGWINWESRPGHIDHIQTLDPRQPYYCFEIFGRAVYVQSNQVAHWCTGYGCYAEAYQHTHFWRCTKPNDWSDPAGGHFQYTLGEAAQGTVVNEEYGYEDKWDWIGGSGWYIGAIPADKPSLHLEGPFYAPLDLKGEYVSGRFYFLYPRSPHNDEHDHYASTDGDLYEFLSQFVDFYFAIYEEDDFIPTDPPYSFSESWEYSETIIDSENDITEYRVTITFTSTHQYELEEYIDDEWVVIGSYPWEWTFSLWTENIPFGAWCSNDGEVTDLVSVGSIMLNDQTANHGRTLAIQCPKAGNNRLVIPTVIPISVKNKTGWQWRDYDNIVTGDSAGFSIGDGVLERFETGRTTVNGSKRSFFLSQDVYDVTMEPYGDGQYDVRKQYLTDPSEWGAFIDNDSGEIWQCYHGHYIYPPLIHQTDDVLLTNPSESSYTFTKNYPACIINFFPSLTSARSRYFYGNYPDDIVYATFTGTLYAKIFRGEVSVWANIGEYPLETADDIETFKSSAYMCKVSVPDNAKILFYDEDDGVNEKKKSGSSDVIRRHGYRRYIATNYYEYRTLFYSDLHVGLWIVPKTIETDLQEG